MDCTVCVTPSDLKRLSTITERSESSATIGNDREDKTDVNKSPKTTRCQLNDETSEDNLPHVGHSDADDLELRASVLEDNFEDEKNVRYFLVDDSPMAKFSRSVKWAYKKLPVGGGGAVLVLSELESMAARQQREIAQQRRLLEEREDRLAVLRRAQEPAPQDRLARLRHRLDQQQSKLDRLRQLRSQTNQSRANNATLTSDLDCIKALFNDKEKELSLAVAKVEELTRQLEELRGRRNGANGSSGNGQMSTPASAELEKLRRELTYRNKINEQQNQVVSQQRLALAQRQAEMASIDARIAQLQGRLQRKRALNQRLSQQLGTANRPVTTQPGFQDVKHDFNNSVKQRPAGNVAAIEPYSHIPNDNDFNLNKNDPKYQTLPYNTKFTVNFKPTEDDVNKNKIQHSASASQIGQRSTFQQFGHQIAHSQSQSHIQGQSQLLGQQTSQQQQTNPQGYAPQSSNLPPSQSGNNNNNNNNNNINANNQQTSGNNQGTSHNAFVQEAPSQVQNSRLHAHQQQQSQQQQQQHQPQQLQHSSIVSKQQQSSTNSSNSSLASGQSITQSYNHRNLQTHQKPVSSVAPSFPVKSPIYQTSSTKIHPVMPQTLSLIGRSHTTNIQSNYPNHPIGPPSSQSPQSQQLAQTVSGHQESNFPLRQNYQNTSQTPGQYSSYRTQNSPNIASNVQSTHLQQANSNYSVYPSQSYNQTSQSGDPSQQPNERSKFDALKTAGVLGNQEKYDLPVKHEQHVRYEQQGLPKHDNQKYEHTSQTTKSYEQMAPKNDQNNGGQQHQNVNKYESTAKHDQNKFETPMNRHEQQHHGGKFEQSQILPGVHQIKHEQHEARGSNSYELNSQFKHEQLMKHDSNPNFSQFKQLQDNSKYEISRDNKTDHTNQPTNQMGKHDHGAKFEPPNKAAEKPYEFERPKSDNDRKLINFTEPKNEDKQKPALPPKPSKPNPPPRLTHHEKNDVPESVVETKIPAPITLNLRSEKEEDIPPIPTSELPESPIETPITNHQIIKARPLALKKAPLSEQPRLRYAKSNVHVSINRRIEMPPAFLFPETEIPADLMQTEQQTQQTTTQQQQQQQQSQNLPDVTDNCKKSLNVGVCEEISNNEKLEDSDIVDALNVINIEDKVKNNKTETDRRLDTDIDSKTNTDVVRRKKGNLKSTTGKANLSRRVSFDPLALLLDASLEGELELVKKTAKEVANPSSANDEGITALHNAICAGHLEIVKFLVEFGCDVNAQDSDGWTPLHCAASCNNLAMVRFLVEHGACIFATTLSDHETAAEKCEEDEEGFDGCSEYLYSVQEKLGIMNNGQVYAVFDYEAQHSDELTLKNGDSLVILRKGDDNEREWWWSKLGHREGYVPRNLLGLYPRVQPAKAD